MRSKLVQQMQQSRVHSLHVSRGRREKMMPGRADRRLIMLQFTLGTDDPYIGYCVQLRITGGE